MILLLSVVSCLLAAFAAAGMFMLGHRVVWLEQQLQEQAVRAVPDPADTVHEDDILVGLNVSVEIAQDHPLRPFKNLLSEGLSSRGATVVDVEHSDVALVGNVNCNGYTNVYFVAHIRGNIHGFDLFSIVRKPPTGDRPANLALEVIDCLASSLKREISRRERDRALSELGDLRKLTL